MYAILIKSRGFKDLEYYIDCLLVKDKEKDLILCIITNDIRAEYFSGVNIFLG